jgi:hypothetical protein
VGVDDAAEARHGVQGGGGVDDVDVEEGEEGEGELGGGRVEGPVELVEGVLDGLPGDDLAEEGEA